MVRGLYPGVRQKSPDIDLMFGLHKQRIENVDTGVTPEARQWLSQPNKNYVIYFISEWLTLSLHNSSTSLATSFLKLTFFLVVL